MKEYTVGEWHAELLSVRLAKGQRGAKVRKFGVKRGGNESFFCMIAALDENGTHEDAELQHVLAALDAYDKQKEESNA